MKTKFFLFALLFVGLGLSGIAQSATPGVTKRQKNQQRQIRQGVRSGELTGREFVRLEREQARTQRMKRRAKADGKVTKRERRRLHRKQNQNRRMIKRQKNDAQKRN